MDLYQQFVRTLFRNYLIGSGVAVLGLGGLVLFTTIRLSPDQRSWLLAILLTSLLMMIASEYPAFRRHLRPIASFFSAPTRDMHLVQQAYAATHRLPLLAVRRILGPHLMGLSIPAMALTAVCIRAGLVSIPYWYILLALVCAVMVACMHAVIEYLLTIRATRPVLQREMEYARQLGCPLDELPPGTFVSIERKLQISIVMV